MLDVIRKVTGRPLQVTYTEGRRFDVPELVLDTTRASRYLQWQPKISLEEGVARTWQWIQSLKSAA
jgi:UDP-glucose 4-epimerase